MIDTSMASPQMENYNLELDLETLEKQMLEFVDHSELEEMLRLQLSEVEMLQSMFPNPGEFVIDDPAVMADMNDFLEGRTSRVPARLDFSINLQLKKAKLEVSVNLPHDYPATEPDVFVRSEKLNRTQQHNLNMSLSTYIMTLDRGEICIGPVIVWLQENAEDYILENSVEEKLALSDSDEKDLYFTRYWIYSHHIYSKVKRRDILDLARECDLTGFCMPGKPGIICVEGCARNCAEWWHKIKAMNWKKIMCKKKEREAVGDQDFHSFKRFQTFEEISFDRGQKTCGRDYHMDMGCFFKYLDEHHCGYVFRDYFGVDGKYGSGRE